MTQELVVAETTIVQFGVLDWEACHERFGDRPASDAYNADKFASRAIFYLTQGVYNMYHALVPVGLGTAYSLCDAVFYAQGNNYEGDKVVHHERSLSIGDVVVLGNGTVWFCASSGWRCLNPGAV
jgi:hypothetical protein